MPQYAEGWPSILASLTTRLSNIPLIGHVYPHMIYEPENPESVAWQDLFTIQDSQDRMELNVWMINRASPPVNTISRDQSQYFTRRHSVEFMGHFQFRGDESWDPWHELIDQVSKELKDGDRTMDKVCLTNSLPTIGDSMYSDFCGIMSLTTKFSFWIEEADVSGTT